jgi:RHS repeat-associated protein
MEWHYDPLRHSELVQSAGEAVGSLNEFTGQERDSETQFDFFKARYFSAAQGRFNSPDPMNAGADPFDPQSCNAYAYVGNNPLTRVDPTGMNPAAARSYFRHAPKDGSQCRP